MQNNERRQPSLQQLQQNVLLLQQIRLRTSLQQAGLAQTRTVANQQQQPQHHTRVPNNDVVHLTLQRLHQLQRQETAKWGPTQVTQEQQPQLLHTLQNCAIPQHAQQLSGAQALKMPQESHQSVGSEQHQQQQRVQHLLQQQQRQRLLQQEQRLLQQQQLLLRLGGISCQQQLNLAAHLVQRQLLLKGTALSEAAPATKAAAAAAAAAAPAAEALAVNSTAECAATEPRSYLGDAEAIRIAKQHAAYMAVAAAAGGPAASAGTADLPRFATSADAVPQLLRKQQLEAAVQQLITPAFRLWAIRQLQKQQHLLQQVRQLVLVLQQQPQLQLLLLQNPRLQQLLSTQPGLLLQLLRQQQRQGELPPKLLESIIGSQQQHQGQQHPVCPDQYAKLLSSLSQEEQRQQQQVQQQLGKLQNERQRLVSLITCQLQQQQQQQLPQMQRQQPQKQQRHEQPQDSDLLLKQFCAQPINLPFSQQESVGTAADKDDEHQSTQLLEKGPTDSEGSYQQQRLIVTAEDHSTAQPSVRPTALRDEPPQPPPQQQQQQQQQPEDIPSRPQAAAPTKGGDLQQRPQQREFSNTQQVEQQNQQQQKEQQHKQVQQQPIQRHRGRPPKKHTYLYNHRSMPDLALETETEEAKAGPRPESSVTSATAGAAPALAQKNRRRSSRLSGQPPGPDLDRSRIYRTTATNVEGSSSSSSCSCSDSSGDENKPPQRQRQQQQAACRQRTNHVKAQQKEQSAASKGVIPTVVADAAVARAVPRTAGEAPGTPEREETETVCPSQDARGAAATNRAAMAAAAALRCSSRSRGKARSPSTVAKASVGNQQNQQQLQQLLTVLKDWCNSASSSSSLPLADNSALLVAALTAAQPLLERLKQQHEQGQQQQSVLVQMAEDHCELVSALLSVRTAGAACLEQLLCWNADKQQKQQTHHQEQELEQQLPQQALEPVLKTPELKSKRSGRPMHRIKQPGSNDNSKSSRTFGSLCGCVAVALHAEAALLLLGVESEKEARLQREGKAQHEHESCASLVSAVAVCVKTHCRETLVPLFSQQAELDTNDRLAGGGPPAAAGDAAAALQRLLEGLRYLWSVAVSQQLLKAFSMEDLHLLAAGLCTIWGVRALPSSAAAASLLRSAEGLLLLLFQFVPQLREPVIDGVLQQFAAAAEEFNSKKGGGKHAAAAAAVDFMDEENEETVAPQQSAAGAAAGAVHPVALLLLRLLQAMCLPNEVYRRFEESSLAVAKPMHEKPQKLPKAAAEGAAEAAAAAARHVARRLITIAVGEEAPHKIQQLQQQQQLLLPLSRPSAGCLRSVRRLIADLALLTLSPSVPASLLLLRAVGYTLLTRLLRPDAEADNTQLQQQQQTALLSLLSALAPAVFAERLPVPSISPLQEQQQRCHLPGNAHLNSDAETARVATRRRLTGAKSKEKHQSVGTRMASLDQSRSLHKAETAKEAQQHIESCCDCGLRKPHEEAATDKAATAGAMEQWICMGCDLRRAVAASLQEAIGRLRPAAWLSVVAGMPESSTGTTPAAAAAAAAAAEGVADRSMLLCVLDEPLTFLCLLLMLANGSSSSSSSYRAASVATQCTSKKSGQELTPVAAAAAVSAAAASAATRIMRLSHRRLLLQHSKAAMACLLLLIIGRSTTTSRKRMEEDDASFKEGGCKGAGAGPNSSRSMLHLIIDIEWEAAAAGDVGLLLPFGANAAAAGVDPNNTLQQQQEQLVASVWRWLALSALQQIGDLLLHAVQVAAGDPRSSVRRAALSVLHACATWRPSLLQVSASSSNSRIPLLLPQALADSSPGVRERALALLDTALQQQQRETTAAAALRRSSQQMLGDEQQDQQARVTMSPWLEEIGGLLRFLRYVVLQETAPSVRQQALRVARGCAAAAPLGETARCCRFLLIEALAAAPDHPATKAFVTGALASEVVRFLTSKPHAAAIASAGEEIAAAHETATQTPRSERTLQCCGGSPLAAAAIARGSASTSSSLNMRRAIRMLASFVAAAREHMEVSLVPLLFPRMQQQLQQQQQQQTLEELAATLLDACLTEYLSCCCGVSPQQDTTCLLTQHNQRQQQQDDFLLDPTVAGLCLLQLAQELGHFCPRGLLLFVPHVAVLLRDHTALLQQGSSSSNSCRSLLGEIELLAAAANHIRAAPYHVQQELLLCVPAVLLLLETDPLLLQAGTMLLCRVSQQLQQEGVRDSLLDLLAVSLALIYSIKDRIYQLKRKEPQRGAHLPPSEEEQQEKEAVVPMLQALQFASWAVACLSAGLGIGAFEKQAAAGSHSAAVAATSEANKVSGCIPSSSANGGAACASSLLRDVPVASLMQRVAAHAADSKSAATAAEAASRDSGFSLQHSVFHLLCDALLLLQQHGGMTAVAWRSLCCFLRAAPSFLSSPRLGARLSAATAAAAANKLDWQCSDQRQHQQRQQQAEGVGDAQALDLPAALQALYGLVKELQQDAASPGLPTAAAAATKVEGKNRQSVSISMRRSGTRGRSQAQHQTQKQEQQQHIPACSAHPASAAGSPTATAAATAAAEAIAANARQGIWNGRERASINANAPSTGPATTAQPSVCDYLHALAPYVRPLMDLLVPRQPQQQPQQQGQWPNLSCSTATLILLLTRALQQYAATVVQQYKQENSQLSLMLGLVYYSELLPQAAALLFCSSRTVARAASLLLQEALGGAGAAFAAGRLQECLDMSLLLCIHRGATDSTATESVYRLSGQGSSSPNLLQLREESAAPVTALLLSPFCVVDPAAISAFVILFTRSAKGSARISPSDVQLSLVAQLRRFSSVEALASLASRLPCAGIPAGATAPAEAAGAAAGPNARLAAWAGSLPPSLGVVAADPAIEPWLQQTPSALLPLLPAAFAALLHLRLVSDVLLSVVHRPSEAADAAAALRGVVVDCGAAVEAMLHTAQQQQQQRQQQHQQQVAALTAAFCGCFASQLRSALLQGFHVSDTPEADSDAAAEAASVAPVDQDEGNFESEECAMAGPKQGQQQQQQQQQKRGRGLLRQPAPRNSSSSRSSSRNPHPRGGGMPDCDSRESLAAAPQQSIVTTARKKSPISLGRSKCSGAPLPVNPEDKPALRLFAAGAALQRRAVSTLGSLWARITTQQDLAATAASVGKTAAESEDTPASLIREMVDAAVCCDNELIICADSRDLPIAHLHRGARRRKRLQLQQRHQQQQQPESPPTSRRRKRRRFGVRKGEDPRDSDWARDVETSEPTAESDEDFSDH